MAGTTDRALLDQRVAEWKAGGGYQKNPDMEMYVQDLGGGNYQLNNRSTGGGAKPAATPAAPAASAPAPSVAAMAPAAPAASAGATVAGGGSKIVDPGSDSMAGLQQAAGMGGGADMSGAPGDNISGPSKFRQGIGQRIPSQMGAALAGLRQAY